MFTSIAFYQYYQCMKQKISILAFFIIIATVAFAQPQGKEDLQKKEAELKREILELNTSLEQIQKNKKKRKEACVFFCSSTFFYLFPFVLLY